MEDNDKPLFQGMDELERTYAPQELPPDDPARERVRADEHGDSVPGYEAQESLSAMPVANLADAPSASMAPLDTGREERHGAPGDPSTEDTEEPLDNS